jgi:hypothetical protein
MDQPAQWQDSRQSGLRPFASAFFRQRMLPEDVIRFRTFSSVFVLPWIGEVPLGANFVHGCFVAHIAAS